MSFRNAWPKSLSLSKLFQGLQFEYSVWGRTEKGVIVLFEMYYKKHLKFKEILIFDDIEVSYLIAHMSRDMTKPTK